MIYRPVLAPAFENAISFRRSHQHTDRHFVVEVGRQRGDGGGDGNVFGLKYYLKFKMVNRHAHDNDCCDLIDLRRLGEM